MIPASEITRWGVEHPWSTREQVEQDLLLSQAICEVSTDLFLGKELLLRGGTAFHKLFLPKPLRYSEDLDYVRTSAGGIGEIMKRLTTLGGELGYSVNTKMGLFPKVFWKGTAESGLPIKINFADYVRFSTATGRITAWSFVPDKDLYARHESSISYLKKRRLFQYYGYASH